MKVSQIPTRKTTPNRAAGGAALHDAAGLHMGEGEVLAAFRLGFGNSPEQGALLCLFLVKICRFSVLFFCFLGFSGLKHVLFFSFLFVCCFLGL